MLYKIKQLLKRCQHAVVTDTTRDIILSIIIGILTGLASVYIIKLEGSIERLLYSRQNYVFNIRHVLRLKTLIIFLLPLSGAIFFIIVKTLFFKDQKMGYGFPDFIVNVNKHNAKISIKTVLYLLLFTPIIIGTGNMAGVEGPIAQIGGGFGSFLSDLMGEENRKRRKLLIAAGTAAGIASIFNAPITGVFFAIEIVLLGEYNLNSLSLIVISAITGTLVRRSFLGNEAIFSVPTHRFSGLYPLIGYALLGIFVGIFAFLFEKWFFKSADYFKGLKLRANTKPLIGSAVIGMIGILLPMSLGNGYPVISMALTDKLSFFLILFLFIAKFIGTPITIGSGLPGGIYAPSLYIGAMLGGTIGYVFTFLFPHNPVSVGVFAIIGMSAFLVSITHAPFTGIFLVFELTNDYKIILPFMLASITAILIKTRIFPDSIEHYPIREFIKRVEIEEEKRDAES